MVTVPSVGLSTLPRICRRVDLPEPEDPVDPVERCYLTIAGTIDLPDSFAF